MGARLIEFNPGSIILKPVKNDGPGKAAIFDKTQM
jgi:hypothetical protein